MSEMEIIEVNTEAVEEENAPDNFYIDILTGSAETANPKKLLVQKVLRQLTEGYGFNRGELETNYNPRIAGRGKARIDIAIFQSNTENTNDNLQRIIVCVSQKKRDKLRTFQEADADVQTLREWIESLPNTSLGMWTNGQEEFVVRVEQTRFETTLKPIGVWPAPDEGTTDLNRTGGVVQVAAYAEGLQDALSRCLQYLNRNLGLDHKDAFGQLAVLVFAKMYDETQPIGDRQFWIKGEEPFTEEGQQAIADRISQVVTNAKAWQPSPDGEELIFNEEVIERVRHGNQVEIRSTTRRDKKVHDELPIVADKFREFLETGEVTL